MPDASATDAGRILALTEAMGISTHGLARVRTYLDRIHAGGIDPSAGVSITRPAPALCHVDGRHGLGPAVAEAARRAASDAARAAGIGAAFVRGGTHLGALAPYLWQAAEDGFAAVFTTNTAPMIAPAGGLAPRIGNNPIGIAVPHPEGHHAILDMALSVAARSRIRRAEAEGRPIPETWATDAEGRPTTDPVAAMNGLMLAIGGEKGAHLALMLDMLAGGFSGASVLDEVPNANVDPAARLNLGHMLILIDIGQLLPDDARRERLEAASNALSGTPARYPDDPPRMPGSRGMARLLNARRNGLELPSELLAELRALAGG